MSNTFSFVGTVGKEAEVRTTPSGQTVLNVTVANNIGYGERQKTLWIRVILWGKRAEGNLQQFLQKGQQVFVSGELVLREYQDNTGVTRSALELTANIIDLVGKKRDNAPPAQSSNTQSGSTPPPTRDNFDDFDDIPF